MAVFRAQLNDYELKRIAEAVVKSLEPLLAERLSAVPIPEAEKQSDWLTIEQAAQRFGVGYHVIREAIKAGELLAYKPGRFYRIRPNDLDAWAIERASRCE